MFRLAWSATSQEIRSLGANHCRHPPGQASAIFEAKFKAFDARLCQLIGLRPFHAGGGGVVDFQSVGDFNCRTRGRGSGLSPRPFLRVSLLLRVSLSSSSRVRGAYHFQIIRE